MAGDGDKGPMQGIPFQSPEAQWPLGQGQHKEQQGPLVTEA